MELSNQIRIEKTPAVINVNFDALKRALEKDVKKYDIVVTAETVSDAKKLATELNKTRDIINTRRKDEVAEASLTINSFSDQMKELAEMCVKSRKKILDQVDVFEDLRRETVKTTIEGYIKNAWITQNILPEFQNSKHDDLIKLTAITPTGKLTSSVKQKLDARIQADKQLQDQTERRLLVLENQSYKAGLKAPLERAHVEVFLFDKDDQYQQRLDSILSSEVARQEKAKAALMQDINEDAYRSPEVIAERAPARAAFHEAQAKPIERSATSAPAVSARKVRYSVQCTFDIEIPDTITTETIEKQLRNKMISAGITHLSNVQIFKG